MKSKQGEHMSTAGGDFHLLDSKEHDKSSERVRSHSAQALSESAKHGCGVDVVRLAARAPFS